MPLKSSCPAFELRTRVLADPGLIGSRQEIWVPADDEIDMLMKGNVDRAAPERDRRIKDNQIAWVDRQVADGRMEKRFNTNFFLAGDSRDPELAGIRGALVGSMYTLMMTGTLPSLIRLSKTRGALKLPV